jgi:hypothetical protein
MNACVELVCSHLWLNTRPWLAAVENCLPFTHL